MKETGQGNLLLIEDHRDIADMVYEYLEERGFTLDYAADGITGLHLAVTQDYDAIILDLMLPGMDGIEVLQKLRTQARRSTPLLILTARDTLQEKVAGLEAGADDYLVKPFAIQELEARVRALVRRRRGGAARQEVLAVADLRFDTGTMTVTRAGKPVRLTPIGARILAILMEASPRLVSRREIERRIWGDILPDSDTLRSHVYNLRKAVDRDQEQPLIHTVQNTGYRLALLDGPA